MSDDKILICGTADNVPGSAWMTAVCGHQVVVSPSSMQLALADDSVKFVCFACMPTGAKEALASGELREVPGQRQELRAIIGDEADRFLDRHAKPL